MWISLLIRQEEKGAPEDEMVGWHHGLDRQEFGQAPQDGEEQGSPACMGLRRLGHDWATEQQQRTTDWVAYPTEMYCLIVEGFPGGSAAKESAHNVGDLGSIPGLGRSPGEGKGSPLQCSGLKNSMDCTVHGVAKSWTRLSDFQAFKGRHLNFWSTWALWSALPVSVPCLKSTSVTLLRSPVQRKQTSCCSFSSLSFSTVSFS